MAKLDPNEQKLLSFSVVALASVVFLVPWTVWIFNILPDRQIAHNWDLAWTGFDAALSVVLLITALLALRKSSWATAFAPVCAAMLIIDAWFDITTASTTSELHSAIFTAIFAEIPLAIACMAATIFAHNAVVKGKMLKK